jgi:single-strand DNA-binding protein
MPSGKTFVTIVGNAGDDPELRYTPTGQPMAKVSVAVTPRVKALNDEWTDGETTWYRVTAWRDMAEHLAESVQKGTRVIVYGSLENRRWEDKEGNTRYSLELNAETIGLDIQFTNYRKASSEREQPAKSESAGPAQDSSRRSTAKRPAASKQAASADSDTEEPPW